MAQVDFQSVATLQPQNSTAYPPAMFNSSDWHLIYTIIPPYIFIVCLAGILGNVLVLLVFFLQQCKWSVPEIYLGNLALADLILLVCLPFWAMNILNHFHWPYGDFLCKVVNLSIIVNIYVSIYVLVMVNIDRYLALVLTMTMKARWLRRRRNTKIICFCIWLFGVGMGVPTVFFRTVQYDHFIHNTACIINYPSKSWKVAHNLQLKILGFALPLLVIIFCSCNICWVLHKRKEGVRPHAGNDRKATVLVCAVTLLFFICWAPFHIFTFMDTLCDFEILDVDSWYHTLDIGSQFSAYLSFLNSCLNPVLYVCSGRYFRMKISKIYKRRKSSTGSVATTMQRTVISTYVLRSEQMKRCNVGPDV